jgi:hypothetical protein
MLPSMARRISEWMPLMSGSELVKSPAEVLSVRRTMPCTVTVAPSGRPLSSR